MYLWIAIAVTCYTVYYLFTVYCEAKRLPPGPFPLPLIGNLHLLSSGKPYLDLTRLARKYGPVYRIQMGCNLVVVVNNSAFAKDAMIKRGADFSGRPEHFVGSLFSRNGKGVGFQTYTETWKTQSKAITSKIKEYIRKDNKMESLISMEADELICRISDLRGVFINPRNDVMFAFGNILTSLAFGKRYEDAGDVEFWQLMNALGMFIEGLAATSFIDTFPFLKYFPFTIIKSVKDAVKERDRILNRKFDEHKLDFEGQNKHDVEDLTDLLIKMTYKTSHDNPVGTPDIGNQEGHPGNQMTEDHIIMTMNDAIIAGTETPTMIFLWILYFLAKYPSIQRRIQRQIDDFIGSNVPPKWEHRQKLPYLQAFFTEVLRNVSIMPLAIPHKTLTDTSLGPYKVPKGTTVFINMYAIHHDPEVWENPEDFVPERFLDENGSFCVERTSNMVAFGVGHRSCPGEALAKMEMFLFTSRLLQKFSIEADKHIALPSLDDAIFGITLRPADFKVSIRPRA